jgi:hypothetical protein
MRGKMTYHYLCMSVDLNTNTRRWYKILFFGVPAYPGLESLKAKNYRGRKRKGLGMLT